MGVLHALEELGIPVDYIGGTSMGSFVGGIASMNRGEYIVTRQKVKQGAMRLSSLKEIVWDLTFPAISWV